MVRLIYAPMEKIGSSAKLSHIFKKGDTAILLFCGVMIQLLNSTQFFILRLEIFSKKTQKTDICVCTEEKIHIGTLAGISENLRFSLSLCTFPFFNFQ